MSLSAPSCFLSSAAARSQSALSEVFTSMPSLYIAVPKASRGLLNCTILSLYAGFHIMSQFFAATSSAFTVFAS